MAEELSIVIGADVTAAKAGINSVSAVLDDFARKGKLSIGVIEQSMEQLKAVIKTTSDPTELNKLKDAYHGLQLQLASLKNESGLTSQLGGISRASRTAHTDLEQISQSIRGLASGNERGIDALSNLVFTFERLSGQTGGAKAALAALGQALIGPAGIVLAFSALLPLAEKFVSKLFETANASKEAQKNAEEFKKTVQGIFTDTAKEAAQASVLIDVLKNETETRERKLAAIKELQKIQPDVFKNLKLEGDAVVGLDTAYKNYLESLKTVIAVKIKQAQLEDTITKLLQKQGITTTGFDKGIQDANKQLDTLIAQKEKAGKPLNSFEIIRKDQAKREADDIKKLSDQITGLNEDIQKLSKGVKVEIKTGTSSEGLTELQRKLIALANQAQEFFNIPLRLKFLVDDTEKTKLQKAIQILEGIKDHTIRLNVIVPDKVALPKAKLEIDKPEFTKSINDLLSVKTAPIKLALTLTTLGEQLRALNAQIDVDLKFDPLKIRDSLNKLHSFILTENEKIGVIKFAIDLGLDTAQDQAKFAQEINRIKNFIPKKLVAQLDIDINTKNINDLAVIQDIAKMNEDISKAINDFLQNISSSGLSSIGEFIGNALSSGDLGKSFQEFGKTIGQAVEALGKQVIALGIAAILAKQAIKALFANPGVAIAAGIALVAVGKALENLLGGGIQAREKGGPVQKGKPYIVGEKGYELFVPDESGKIISHDKLLQSESVKEYNSVKEYFVNRRIDQLETRIVNFISKASEQSQKTTERLIDKISTYSESINKSVSFSNVISTQKINESIKFVTSATSAIVNKYDELSTSTNEVLNKKEISNKTSEINNLRIICSYTSEIEESLTKSFEKLIHQTFNTGKVVIERFVTNNINSKENSSIQRLTIDRLQKVFNIPAFAEGGAVFGPTLAILGEGFGISRANPELVGTANQLKGIMGGAFDLNLSLDLQARHNGNDLLYFINKAMKTSIRTTGRTGL